MCSFMTSDNIYEYISNMRNNLCPYSVASGEENYYLLAPSFKLFKRIILIVILYWTEDTFRIQRTLLEKWNCVKIIQIVIRTFNQKNNLTIKIL